MIVKSPCIINWTSPFIGFWFLITGLPLEKTHLRTILRKPNLSALYTRKEKLRQWLKKVLLTIIFFFIKLKNLNIVRRNILIAVLFYFTCVVIYAQEKGNSSLKIRRNYIIVNVGPDLIAYNFNYERNIIQSPKSFTNIRLGYGKWEGMQDMGTDYSITLVHLIGQKNSHLELNLGLRYRIGEREDINTPPLMPDIFAGYRYEKPYGILIFRAGLSIPSVISIGVGFKF